MGSEIWPRRVVNKVSPGWITAEYLLVIYKRRSGACKLFLLCRSRLFLSGRSASENWEVWGMILIMCLVMIDTSETRPLSGYEGHRWIVPRVLILHMQNRFLLLISHDATAPGRGDLEAYVRLSTGWLPHLKYMTNGFLCVYFLRSLLGWTNAWVCHPHRGVNISISVFVAAVEVTTKCSMQLHTLDQQPADVSSAGRYLLPLLCDPWIYANLDSCAYTCVREHTCMQQYVYAHVYIN